jgi:hypothetical protein
VDASHLFFVIGLICGGAAMWAGMVVFEWFRERWVRPVELDTSVERLRALGRHPSQAELQLLAEENIERYRRQR